MPIYGTWSRESGMECKQTLEQGLENLGKAIRLHFKSFREPWTSVRGWQQIHPANLCPVPIRIEDARVHATTAEPYTTMS